MKPVNNATGPVLEQMEDRLLLSAVYAVVGHAITITGDTAPGAAAIVIDDNAGSLRITGATAKAGTGALPTLLTADQYTITVNLKDVANTVTLSAATTALHPLKAFVVNGGKLADTVSISAGNTKDVTIAAKDGANVLSLAAAITGNLKISTGKDVDTVTFGTGTYGTTQVKVDNRITVRGTVISVLTGAGADQVNISTGTTGTAAFAGSLTVDTGIGNDVVKIASSANQCLATFASAVSLKLGDGADTLSMAELRAGNNVAFNAGLKLDFGKGADVFNVAAAGLVSTVTLGGTSVINLGTSTLPTPADAKTGTIKSESIVLAAGSVTSIALATGSKATVSTALKNGIAAGLSYTGSINSLSVRLV
jgi:hypothetical protein